jgi:hypothetical protein
MNRTQVCWSECKGKTMQGIFISKDSRKLLLAFTDATFCMFESEYDQSWEEASIVPCGSLLGEFGFSEWCIDDLRQVFDLETLSHWQHKKALAAKAYEESIEANERKTYEALKAKYEPNKD